VASVATVAALLSHLAGGGAVPGWLGLLVPWALSLTVCTVLAGRRLELWRTTVSVGLSQVLFHTLFVLGAPGAGASGAGASGAGSADRPMGHGVHGEYPLPPSSPEVSPYLPDLIGADATMWLWHGAAAGVTVAVLFGGERVLTRLRELAGQATAWLRRSLPARSDVAPPVPVVRVVAPDWFTGSFSARPEVSSSRRRGPPRAHAI
jgi:hypothetical protein